MSSLKSFAMILVPVLLSLVSSSSFAFAQERTEVLFEAPYGTLGEKTETAEISLDAGWAPLNDEVAFVYDPEFYFFMRGFLNQSQFDRTEEFSDYGYVLVYAAGDPGGYYRTTPTWISHESFDASYDEASSSAALSYTYETTYVPTFRGFQNFLVYANVEKAATGDLTVYDDELAFGPNRYLLTGDGQQEHTRVFFNSAQADQGTSAIEIHTEQDSGAGTHYKLMLFAHGSAAAFDGIDLSSYGKLVFRAKANRSVVLQGAFGTGDDSGQRGLGAFEVSTEYQTFELDLTGLDLSDVNTFLQVYVHKAQNPFDFSGLSVYLDDIMLLEK